MPALREGANAAMAAQIMQLPSKVLNYGVTIAGAWGDGRRWVRNNSRSIRGSNVGTSLLGLGGTIYEANTLVRSYDRMVKETTHLLASKTGQSEHEGPLKNFLGELSGRIKKNYFVLEEVGESKNDRFRLAVNIKNKQSKKYKFQESRNLLSLAVNADAIKEQDKKSSTDRDAPDTKRFIASGTQYTEETFNLPEKSAKRLIVDINSGRARFSSEVQRDVLRKYKGLSYVYSRQIGQLIGTGIYSQTKSYSNDVWTPMRTESKSLIKVGPNLYYLKQVIDDSKPVSIPFRIPSHAFHPDPEPIK